MRLNPVGLYPMTRAGAEALARDLGVARSAILGGIWPAPAPRPRPGRRRARRMARRGY